LRDQAVTVPPKVIEATGTPLAELLALRDALQTLTTRLRTAAGLPAGAAANVPGVVR
jgi:hypothetical protein